MAPELIKVLRKLFLVTSTIISLSLLHPLVHCSLDELPHVVTHYITESLGVV